MQEQRGGERKDRKGEEEEGAQYIRRMIGGEAWQVSASGKWGFAAGNQKCDRT